MLNFLLPTDALLEQLQAKRKFTAASANHGLTLQPTTQLIFCSTPCNHFYNVFVSSRCLIALTFLIDYSFTSTRPLTLHAPFYPLLWP